VLTLGVVLAVAALVVPAGAVRNSPAALVTTHTAEAVGHSPNVIWILCLGSDARPGQAVTATRADAIQLVGVNVRTGAATDIGIPRDSYVDIPGHGRNKINAAMFYGGPQLMADVVGNMVGIHPDYVFTTGFKGFWSMVHSIGGVTVHSKYAWSAPQVRPQGFHVGKNHLNGVQALAFGRERHALPRGDFDRSANQQELLRSILRKVHAREDQPGFMERGLMSAFRNLNTNLRPSELFTLAQAVTQIRLSRFRGCVVNGSTGYVGAASVVFPDVAQARRLGNQARDDATLGRGC
jgi:LCP family protein required for cell wall assembly